jgi:hypothetical protein
VIAASLAGPGATAALGAILILFTMGSLWGALKSHNFNGLIALVGMLATMYVGWYLRGYVGIDHSQGMLLALWHGWLDSIRVLAIAFLDLIGLDSVWNSVSDFWTTHFQAVQ